MARSEKVEKVRKITERFQAASGAMFADFRGLSVKDAMELRRALRQADTTLLVSKNTLTRLAVRDAGLDEGVLELLQGPTAIAFIDGDPIAGAKALVDSAKRFPAIVIKGAVVDGRVLREVQAQALATVESREVSLAKIAGLLQSPLSRIAYLLQAPLQRLAYALAERGKQAGEVAEAPADETPAADTVEVAPDEGEGDVVAAGEAAARVPEGDEAMEAQQAAQAEAAAQAAAGTENTETTA